MKDPSAPTAAAGLGFPSVATLPTSGVVEGQTVYFAGDNKLRFWNGTI